MSNLILTLQNCYALVYYTIGLFHVPALLSGSFYNLSAPFIASIVYFIGDCLVQMYMDIVSRKLSYLVYVHHAVPLILLSQVDPVVSLDRFIFGVLLLTEVSSVFLALKYLSEQLDWSTKIKKLCRNMFALTFIGVRGFICTSLMVSIIPEYRQTVSSTKFAVVETSLGLIVCLNTYWTYLIICKIKNKTN